MNNSVSEMQIKGFSLRLRTTSSGSYVLPPIYSNVYIINNSASGEVTFQFSAAQAKALTEGQYYKIQIAYCATQVKDEAGNISGEDIGYYSTVGVAKCVSKPTVTIRNLVFENINAFNNEYLGFYDLSNCKDHTEKVYSYEFKIYDPQDNIFYTSGEKLHQSSYDVDYTSSIDRIQINDFASTEVIYSIEYTVTTLNGLVISSPKYKISSQYLIAPNGNISVKPVADAEHGFIDVHLLGEMDPNHSYYYILDIDLLDGLEVDENNKPLEDGSGFTAATKTKDTLNNYPSHSEKLEFLNTHYLYKFHQYHTHSFFYTYLGSRMTSFIEIQGRFYNKSDLQAYVEMKVDIPLEALDTLDYYEKVISGKNVLKSLSYQYVEDNFIDINKKFVIGTTEREKKYFGSYLLSRASDEDNYTTWFNIARFRMDDQIPSDFSIKDVTVEHGRKYKYAIQQYNIWGLYSARIVSKEFEASFEDIFLYDGERSLRVRYNPTVDSFKTTILEQKTDTIGGKYPFITRNGATYYKEFPVGGLLAQEIDDMHYFVNPQWDHTHRHSSATNLQYERDEDKYTIDGQPENALWNSHDFSDTTIALERNFKLEVLDWLNNGKPKLFKSPYEGNYIVRLMNVSLSPVKELGRMLHSFSSQAYEIADCTYENLVAFGFIKTAMPSDLIGLWKTYDLRDDNLRGSNGDIIIAFEHGVQSFTVQDLMPGDIIYLQFADQNEELPIMIGITGSYTYEGINNNLIRIRIPQPEDHELNGMLNCFYTGMRITDFDSITNMMLKTIVSQQYIGTSPWMQKLKRIEWDAKGNADTYRNLINDSQYKELQNYNFRTYLERTVTPLEGSNYYPSESFARLANSFDPGELLDRINLTINQGEKYKTELLNIEMLRFRERPLIPVYTESRHRSGFYTPGEYSTLLNKRKFDIKTGKEGETKRDILLCATSPYGYPHPIEELAEYEMLDPFCIYQVFEYNAELDNWQPIISDAFTSYYDPYYRTWLSEEYDPIVKMNFNWVQVALLEDQIIGYCAPEQLEVYQTYNISLTGQYWSNNNKEIKFTLSEAALSNLVTEPDEELGYIVPIYSFTDDSQYLVERNRIHQANKAKKERGEYIDQAINEREMFDYQLEKSWEEKIIGSSNIIHYHYTTDKGIYSIKENKYDLFEKINDQYFAIRKETVIPNTVYWVKQYDIELNMTTEKMVEYTNIDLMNSYHIGNGVVAELTFQLRVIDYYTEIYDNDVRQAKEDYLNAKNFYAELMKLYNIIAKANLERNINRAFMKLYQKLIYGNKDQNDLLDIDDKNTIQRTLNQYLSKEELKLQSLYEIFTINSAYNREVLDLLIDYKSNYSTKDMLQAFYNAEIYYYIEQLLTDTLDGYYILDKRDFYDESEDKKFYIIDTDTITDETPEEDIIVYRYRYYANGDVYFYKVNKKAYINENYFAANPTAQEDKLVILYVIDAKETEPKFKVVNKDYVTSTGSELYTLKKQEDPAYISYTNLLNADELAAIKLEKDFLQSSLIGTSKIIGFCSLEQFEFFKENYIKEFNFLKYSDIEYYILNDIENNALSYGNEVYFTNEILSLLSSEQNEEYYIPVYSLYKILYEETEINDILNDQPIEGVNYKYQNLSKELDNINKEINEMQTQNDNLELTYINAYMNMYNAIKSYNKDVYTDWCARALNELFDKNSNYYANAYEHQTSAYEHQARFIKYYPSEIRNGATILDPVCGYCSDAQLSLFDRNLENIQDIITYYTVVNDNRQYGVLPTIRYIISPTQTDVYKYPVYVAQYYEMDNNSHFKKTTDSNFNENKTYYRFYNNIDYFKDWYHLPNETTELIIDLKNAYQIGQSNSTVQISEEGEKIKKTLFAGNELYESIGGNLPNIQNFQQIIKDQDNDIKLDDYIEELIAIQSGQIVLEFYALHESIEDTIEALNRPDIADILTKEEWQTTVNNCVNLIDKYNIIYDQIIENHTFKRINDDIAGFANITKFISNLRTKYTELYTTQIANSLVEDNIFQMEDLALLSNYENDERYLSNNVPFIHQDISFKYRDYDNPLEGQLIDSGKILRGLKANATIINISPLHTRDEPNRYDPMSTSYPYNIFANTIRGWNTNDRSTFMGPQFKNISTYFYRSFFPVVYAEGTETILLNQFILNPFSDVLLDEALIGSGYTSNREYFENLPTITKNQVLNLHNTISGIMINMLSNLGGTSSSGWRASIETKKYIKDPNTQEGLYTILANIIGLSENNTIQSEGKILKNLIDNAKEYLRNYYGSQEYILPTITPVRIMDVNFEIPFDAPMNYYYLIPYNNSQPVLIPSDGNIQEHYYKEINFLNNWYQAVTLDEQMLIEITKVIIEEEGNSGVLSEQGLYWEYLLTYINKIKERNELKEECENLLRLYQKQLDVYLMKYEQYNQKFETNQDIYSSYFGTEAYKYYNLLNSDVSEEEKNTAIQQKRAVAQEAWWKFLDLLDARYTAEKERGMYV